MGALFGGNKFNAQKAAEDQRNENARNVTEQAANAGKYGNVNDQFGGTRRFIQNADGTYSTTSELGQTGKDYLSGMATLGQQSRDALSHGFDTIDPAAVQAQADKFYGSSSANLTRNQQAQREALDSRLRNQGAVPGTEAYEKAMRGFENSASDATTSLYGKAMQDAYGMASGDLANARNFALGANAQAGGVLGRTLGIDGSGVPNIQTPGAVNIAGMELQQAQMDQQRQNALWGALGGIGGGLLGMPGVGGAITGGLGRLGANIGKWTGGF